MENKLGVLVFGYDGYKDIFGYFSYFFDKNWPTCTYKRYFSSTNIPISNPRFVNCQNGQNTSVYKKIQEVLQKSSEEYFFILLEDYILSKNIQDERVEKAFLFVEKYDLDYCSLYSFGKIAFEGKNAFPYEISKKQRYRISLQPAIWKRYLLEKIVESRCETFWDVEILFHEKLDSGNFSKNLRAAFYRPSRISICNFIIKGKLTRKAQKLIQRNRLEKSSRVKMSFSETITIKVGSFFRSYFPRLRIIAKKIGKKLGKKYYTSD